MKYISPGDPAVAGFVFYKNGVPTTPAVVPAIVSAYFNDTLLSPLPSIGAPDSPGAYSPEVFSASQTLTVGYYCSMAHTTDATMDTQFSLEEWTVQTPALTDDPLESAVPGSYASGTAGWALGLISAIKAMTDKISLPGIFFAPFFGSPDSSVKTIWRWRDYLLTNGQQIDYQIVGLDPADVVTWTIACAGQETTKTLTYVAADTPLARLQLTRTETGAFVRGEWPVEVYVTNTLGDKAEKYYSTIRIKDVLKK